MPALAWLRILAFAVLAGGALVFHFGGGRQNREFDVRSSDLEPDIEAAVLPDAQSSGFEGATLIIAVTNATMGDSIKAAQPPDIASAELVEAEDAAVLRIAPPAAQPPDFAAAQLLKITDVAMLGRLLVVPKLQLVYCPIQKVACAEWKSFTRYLAGQKNWQETIHDHNALAKLGGIELPERWSTQQANNVFHDRSWSFYVVLREPLERLMSCYLQKCSPWNRENAYNTCPYLELWPSIFSAEASGRTDWKNNKEAMDRFAVATAKMTPQAVFGEYARTIAARVTRDPCHQNEHWAPQWCHCGLEKLMSRYWALPFPTMVEGMVNVLGNLTKIPPERRAELQGFTRYWMGTNHDTPGKQRHASEHEDLYDDELRAVVRKAFQKDYDLFGHLF